jgi:lysozyme
MNEEKDPGYFALGIDVSSHQGHVDWGAVQASGVVFAFARATTGGATVDDQFAKNWSGMAGAGILRGAYHFYWATSDPRAQAASFARVVTLEPDDLPPVLDLEHSADVTRPALLEGVGVFLRELERLVKRRPVVYTNLTYWNTWMQSPEPPPWTDDYPLWISHWTQAARPTLPNGWSAWRFWQFDNKGSVPGIRGDVDRNRFNGTAGELGEWASGVTFA